MASQVNFVERGAGTGFHGEGLSDSVRRFSPSTTLFTRPIRRASSAVINLPERRISVACPLPMMRGSLATPSPACDGPDLDFRMSEEGMARGDSQCACLCKLKTSAKGVTVERRDHYLS